MRILKILGIFIGLAFTIIALEPVHAAVFNCPAGDVDCLIDAINTANTNGETDTINLEAGTYRLKKVDNIKDNANGLPSITSPISIKGAGAGATSIKRVSTAPQFRIFHVGSTGALTLNGLTIRGADSADWGGGIFTWGTLTIANCIFLENKARSLTEPERYRGGAICTREYSVVTITNTTFSKNHAGYSGGAIYNWKSSPTITGCTFLENQTHYGGGISMNDSSTTISNSTFLKNHASALGGGICVSDSSSPTIRNSNFSNNWAHRGGGIYSENSSPEIYNSTFSNNTALFYGGGIYNYYSTTMIVNSTFINNEAYTGGGINNARSAAIITNSTVAKNYASEHGGGVDNWHSSSTITNSILWLNDAPTNPEITITGPEMPTISYCDIDQDGFAGSNGNIRQDPLFVDVDKGDVHLRYGSPCIDAGTSEGAPNYDIDGDVRPQGLGYDIGADEYVLESFADVPPGYWAEDAIYKIYEAGITKGCSQDPLMFCPQKTVKRDQMAVFLGRATHNSNFTPPAATGIFADVPKSYWAADWIEQFYADGLTKGCKIDPHNPQATVMYYCPERPVIRTTMAIFLLRANHGANYVPPPATGIFEDVWVNYWAADWIEQLYKEGITKGCKNNPLMYCPEVHVRRDVMAVFLARMLGL